MASHDVEKFVDGNGDEFKFRDNSAVHDVKIDGTSVVSSGTASIPMASSSTKGVVKVDDAMSSSSTNPVQNKVVNTAIADCRTKSQDISKGANLVVNGSGRMSSNYNFTSCSYIPTIANGGSAGSFGFSGNVITDEYISCDFNKKIVISADIKNLVAQPTSCIHRIAIYEYDIDKKQVVAPSVKFGVGTLTTLTQDLNPGDTVVHLADLSNSGWLSSTTYHRGFIFWNYRNSLDYLYPPETYSRNFYPSSDSSVLWDVANVDVVAGTITLNSAWSGPAIPSGTKVSRRNSSGLPYPASSNFYDTEWHSLKGAMKGIIAGGSSSQFSPPTAFIKVGLVPTGLSNTDTVTNKRAVVTNFFVYEEQDINDGYGTLPVNRGGTGATTAIGAEYNILNQVADIDTTVDGDRKIALCNQSKSASNGVFRWIKLSNIWTWIKSKLRSDSNVNISGSSASCTGNAATASAAQSGSTLETAINGKAPTNHASSSDTYGKGTTSNYGHVKLATGDMNGASNVDGVACSKNHTHSQYLTSQDISGKMNTSGNNAVAPSGNGGNGATATLLNNLTGPNNLDPITSDDVLIPTTTSDAGDQIRWFKRPVSKLWSYIKGKMTSDSGVNISGTAATAKAYDTSFSGTNSIASALSGKSSTSHTHVADANDVTDSATGSDLSEVTDTTEFVTTNIGGYSSADKKLYRRPFGTKVWPWIQSKLGSVGSNSSPIYLDSGVPKTMERSIVLYDTRTGQEHLNPYFSARIDETHYANLEAWDNSGDLKVGIWGRNGTKGSNFLCYKDANGDNYFNGLARGIYPFLINGVSNQNYAVFAKIVLNTSVAANTIASLRFRLTVLGTNVNSQNMAISDLTLKLLPHESDFWSLCERIHRADTPSGEQQPNSDVGRCIYWISGATVYVGVYTGSWRARVGVEVVSVYGLGSSFTFDVGDFSSSVSGGGLSTYNRTSAWSYNNAGAGSVNLPVYARKDGKLATIGHQLQLPSATGGTGATEGHVKVGYGTENSAYLDATANQTGVWCKTNISGGDTNGGWLCYRTPAGNNIFNGKANTAGDADTVDGFHFVVGTIGTNANTIYFG